MARWEITFLLVACTILYARAFKKLKSEYKHTAKGKDHSRRILPKTKYEASGEENCWMTLHAKRHHEWMDIEDANITSRQEFQSMWKSKLWDDAIIKDMVDTRAMAGRAIFNAGHRSLVPAGINLGGYAVIPMPESVLFVQRMKLRNQTKFTLRFFESNMVDMVMKSRLTLNDLHLQGTYMRAKVNNFRDELFVQPSNGEISLLLSDVVYHVEGRYRLNGGYINVEHILSEMKIQQVTVRFDNKTTGCGGGDAEIIPEETISVYKERLRADLDSWLKDYYNDYLLQKNLTKLDKTFEIDTLHTVRGYVIKKVKYLNKYVDDALAQLKQRLHSMKPRAADVKVPNVTLHSNTGVKIKLNNGVLRGIDSFHRKSEATEVKDGEIRKVDAIIGFHGLKLEYQYEAYIPDVPTLFGLITLTPDDLVAHLSLKLAKEPEAADLKVQYIRGLGPESLVVGGPLSRMIANFKYILEDQIMAVMAEKIWIQIGLLGSLTHCEPLLKGHEDVGDDTDDIKITNRAGPIKLARNDSIELQLSDDGEGKRNKLHIRYKEELELDEKELEKQARKKNNQVDGANQNESYDNFLVARRKNKHHKKRKSHGRKH